MNWLKETAKAKTGGGGAAGGDWRREVMEEGREKNGRKERRPQCRGSPIKYIEEQEEEKKRR